jgi:hypothetical protein
VHANACFSLTIAMGYATFFQQRLSMPGRSACFAKDPSLYRTNDRSLPLQWHRYC